MEPRTRALLLFSLGIVLVLNPVYLFPGGVPGEKTYTYRAEQVETHYDFADAVRPSAVLDCSGSIHHRECVLARQVGYGGTLRVNNDTSVHLEDDERGLFFGYDYVRFDEGYARPNATVQNGTLVLSNEPRSQTLVLREYAVEHERLPPIGKRAVRNGSASTTRRIRLGEDVEPAVAEYERLVEYDGTFYVITRYPGEWKRPVPEWLLTLVRFLGVGGGAALAFVGGSRHARVVDERGRDSPGSDR